jgi:gluconokinase
VPDPLTVSLRGAEDPLVLAVDIGTSGLRASLFDARARTIATTAVTIDHAIRRSSEGEASVDADEMLQEAEQAIDAVLERAGGRVPDIAGAAMSTFWHSLLGCDDHGRPTTPVLTWADTRARRASAALRTELDNDDVHRRTGCYLHASYLPAKLRYLRDADADAYRRSTWWGSLGEHLYARLFGERVVGHGMASGSGLYDQGRRTWDRELLAHLGVDATILSAIDDAPRAGLRAAYARRWPALARIPWLPALGDGACSNVGAGAVGRDLAALMLGTSAAIRVLYEGTDPPVVTGGWTYRLDARRIVAGGALSNAGNVLTWLRDLLPDLDLDSVARRPVGEHGLIALPLLAGDRSPSWNDAASGAVVGIGVRTRGEDIAQATIEGIALRVAGLWELVRTALPGILRLIATGGAAATAPWLTQLCADAIGRPLELSLATAGSARGAAIAALEAIGAIPDLAALPPPVELVFRPREGAHAGLIEARDRQDRLERALNRV